MQMMPIPSWAEFKSVCITRKALPVQYYETAAAYEMFAAEDGAFLWSFSLTKTDPPSPAQIEFDALKSTFNGRTTQIDSDGAVMSRVKVAPSGWNFQYRGVEFATSTLASVVNKDADNSDLADATLKLYKADGTLITDQAVADAECVKTIIDIEPPYDIYIAGGKLKFITQPTEDVRIAVVGVPDVPAVAGGSKHFVQNINLKFLPAADGVNADGRAAKWLQYSATYHTNKIRFLLYHPAGHKMPISTFLELYRQ
jgi:hypothetical protein